jgi:hypothetical protein
VTGWLARAAAEMNNGERRTLAAIIRRMKYLLDVNSNRHNYDTKLIRLSNIFYLPLFINNLNKNYQSNCRIFQKHMDSLYKIQVEFVLIEIARKKCP